MQNPPRTGSPPPSGPPRDGHGRGPGGGGGGPHRRTDDDFRQSIREVFGKDYVALILNPHGGDYNDYLDRVKRFVQDRARQITTSQLRNIFTRVQSAKRPEQLHVLRPRLAYVAGRSDREEMRELVVLLDDLIREVQTEDRVAAFRSFFEAVIAYHKYYNPKES
ncbi:MAG TPA: type III-A CRISPR-associated protein Csm2 [Longimicrobiaceae bacterium]|nr:type III-A CRISPR-associated protein Csm2 [Longimicrobiaceae bacterium]